VLGTIVAFSYHYRKPSPQPSNSQWLYVQPQVLEAHLGLVGRIEPAIRHTIAAPFEGIVQDVAVSEGEFAERGQQLLTIDTTQLDIQLRQALTEKLKAQRVVQEMEHWLEGENVTRARRAVTSSQLNLSDTKAKLADTRSLFERGIVARMEVDSLEQQLRMQQLDLAASEAELRAVMSRGEGGNLQIVKMELANAQARYQALQDLHVQYQLHAPFSGIVLPLHKSEEKSSVRPVQVGMHVTSSMPLYELVSLERIQVVSRVEEADLYQLNEGMPVQITGDGFNGVLHGRIATMAVQGSSSDVGSSTYEVTVAIDTPSPEQRERVRLGMSVRLAIITYRAESGFVVPADCIHLNEDGSTFVIYREDINHTSQRISVTVGRPVPQGIEVFGLKPGYVESRAEK
jgi:multidrug efflux pump subunit AcrA (membrane-fusion protein)